MAEEQTAGARWRRWGRWVLLLIAAFLLHVPFLRQPPRPLSPAERALAAVARQALLSGDRAFDYGGFFLHAEGAAGGGVERRWRGLSTSLREQVGPLGGRHASDGITKLLFLLFREAHLGQYHREEARMSGYFQEDSGGNCEAQTKLLVSALRASTLALPEDNELGVEVYQDHVQAVLVDRRRGTLWNLLTGEVDAKPRSDVYRPAVLLSAYLRGLGLRPPIPEGDLRLVRGPRPKVLHKGWGFFTTSTMKLPAAVARYAEGATPERAAIPLPVPRRPAEAPPSGNDKEATWREEFLQDHDPLQLFAVDRVDGAVGLVGATLVFQQKAQAERYLAMTSQVERRRLLLDLTEARLREEFTYGLPELPPIERLGSWDEATLTGRLHRIQRVEQLVSLAEVTIDRGRTSSMVAGELELRLPELRRVGESVRAFAEAAARTPTGFVRQLSSMDRARRRALLSFFVPRSPTAQVKALAQAISDPAQVALVGGEQGPALPPEVPLVFTEVELLDVPVALPAAGPHASSSVLPAASAPAVVPVAEAVPVATGAYLDLVLSGLFSGAAQDALPLLARWDASVSEHLAHSTVTDPRCSEVLLQLQMAVLRPLNDANKPVPAHLEAAVRKLERGCKR